MKKILLGLAIVLSPLSTHASAQLEYQLIRTPETPGFFAVTIYPSQNSTPLQENYVFIKNFRADQQTNYIPVLDFLNEIGANVLPQTPTTEETKNIVTLGENISTEKNFQTKTPDSALEEFENFALKNLQPTYLRNINAEFGGNISSISQSQQNLTGDNGITFIGKFEKDRRTRMAITAEDDNNYINFETPLDLRDLTLSNHPLAKELPHIWEDMQPKKIISSNNLLELFPWILGSIGLLILGIIFIRRTQQRYQEFLEEQETLQTELPWSQIKKTEATPTNPFEVE